MSHQGRNGRDGGPAHQAPVTAGLILVIAAWLARQQPRVPRRRRPAPPRATGRGGRSRRLGHAAAPRRRSIVSAPAAPSASSPAGGPGAAWPTPLHRRPARAGPRARRPGRAVSGAAGAWPSRSSPPRRSPVPIGDGGGIITVGLKRGVGYRLRVTGIVERPVAELFPVIEVVGHLHRPDGIDPGKYPIRVVFNQDDWTTPSIAAGS